MKVVKGEDGELSRGATAREAYHGILVKWRLRKSSELMTSIDQMIYSLEARASRKWNVLYEERI
jgi:hypothetical protein